MKNIRKRFVKGILAFGLMAALLLGGSLSVFAAGNTISRSKAESIALNAVNVKRSSVKKWIKVRLDNYDYDDDREWDVEFRTSKYKYEVEINAHTGRVEDVDIDRIKTSSGKTISKKKAKSIALKKANVKSSSVKKWIKVKLDNYDDDDDREWDIEFTTSKYKYEIEINARTGRVEDFEKERIHSDTSKNIGIDKAKSIALKHAGITGNVRYVKAKLDRDDGVYYYDIEFKYGGKEYEYEIHAKTGKIVDWDVDWDD